MVYLRVGTRLLFIRAASPDDVCQKLKVMLKAHTVTLEEGLQQAGENHSLLFITPEGLELTDADDAKHILVAEGGGTGILSRIINEKLSSEIQRVDMGPRIMILRVPDHEEKVMQALEKDYDAQRVTWKEGVRLGEKDQTLLGLTTQRIHQALGDNAVYHHHLLINQPITECYVQLRREALLYITHNLKDGSWYEYRINLYDTRGHYELHYQRLVQVIAGLELGFSLGESWTRDHAMALLSVLAYQVRLFSFMPPEEIKKILIGLEYDEAGNRLADFDLYYRNKKIAWTGIRDKEEKKAQKRNKQEEGIFRRNELMDKLAQREKDRLKRLEEALQAKTP